MIEKYFQDKTVLVTGGAGFIGTNLLRELVKLPCRRIIATWHKTQPKFEHDLIQYYLCDLTEQSSNDYACFLYGNVDYVFMCAGVTSGASVMANNPLEHVTPNVVMNSLLLRSALKYNIQKVQFLSSTTVYPNTDHPVKEDEVLTGELFDSYFCVGWTKIFSEILCKMYSTKIKNKLDTVVIRPSQVYGEYDKFDPDKSHVLPALIRKVTKRQNPIEVWGNGQDVKDFIYVKDLVKGMIKAMTLTSNYEEINMASGTKTTVKELLDMIIDIDDYKDAKIVFNTSKPMMIPARSVCTLKAQKLLDFKAATKIKDGLKSTIEWYKKTKDFNSSCSIT